MRFAWDEARNRENRRKHGLPFEEAQTVFFDENALRFFDRVWFKLVEKRKNSFPPRSQRPAAPRENTGVGCFA
jgi:uncharacterized DUF497 family protein